MVEPITKKGNAPFPLQLVTFWRRSKPGELGKGTARTRLLLPSGEQVGKSAEYQVDLTTFKRLRNRLGFNMFPIVETGVHEFVIEVQQTNESWNEVARVPFEITVQVPATGSNGEAKKSQS